MTFRAVKMALVTGALTTVALTILAVAALAAPAAWAQTNPAVAAKGYKAPRNA